MSFEFSHVAVEAMARNLIATMELSNGLGYLCSHGSNQVYGGAYDALKALLYKEIGSAATQYAMNCSTWGIHDFDNQIIPAIEWGIEEAKLDERSNLVKKMMDFLDKNCGCAGWSFYHYRDNNYIEAQIDGGISHQIAIDWNDVHKWLGY